MKKGLTYHLMLLLTALLTLSSCDGKDGFDESFLGLEEDALIVNGNVAFVCSEDTYQYSFNRQRKTFRMGTDGMSDYVVAVFDTLPEEEGGQVMCKSLKWTGKTYLESRSNVEFKVKKISPDGRIWLWSQAFRICLVVRELD